MTVKTFAYIRVSSKEQNEARQLDAMKALGINDRDIYLDKASGKDTNRPQYQALKANVREGDTVVFESITRLSRNMDDVKNEYKWFVDKGVLLRFIKEPMLDSKADAQGVIDRAMADIILTLLAAFSQQEREQIRDRQRAGIEAAKKRGKHLGRPKKSYATMSAAERQDFAQQYNAWKAGKQTAVETFNRLELTKTTFYKIVKEYEDATE
ncbi:recombinase family protein [Rummeliibacillus sp. TYF-LIM-RU47]|uniref:recombinase family protein n=1 Tax=Rummeliibacillus sp. TYF-LIM-RU47 TaxID=2608406 RepID=UPI00123AD7E9|nr:recombinase family protein [Rummeliibacillus sp. TYF-LIM-RU47]